MQERLQKVLSRAGVASRRKAEELIVAGRVEVNGRKVTELGTRVDAGKDTIRVDGVLVSDIEERVYYVLYKPAGCVTTLSDPEGRPTVRDFLRGVTERVYPVGRLDYDAEGALILTNDGELAHRLMHPKFGARRTYLVKVKGDPVPATIARLTEGLRLEDGMAKALEAEIVQHADKNTWVRLVVAEGRPHLVKRLCEAVGHPVQRLFRQSYAGVRVEEMRPGDLRELGAAEVKRLRQGGSDEPTEAVLPPRRDGKGPAVIPSAGAGRSGPSRGGGGARGGRPGGEKRPFGERRPSSEGPAEGGARRSFGEPRPGGERRPVVEERGGRDRPAGGKRSFGDKRPGGFGGRSFDGDRSGGERSGGERRGGDKRGGEQRGFAPRGAGPGGRGGSKPRVGAPPRKAGPRKSR